MYYHRLKWPEKWLEGDNGMSQVSIAEAKNTLTHLIHEAERGEAIHITRHGKPVAVLLSEEAYEQLKSREQQTDFWQAIQAWRAQASFAWPELTPEEVDSWRDRSPGREYSWND
jgi:prevent-host-death family protein